MEDYPLSLDQSTDSHFGMVANNLSASANLLRSLAARRDVPVARVVTKRSVDIIGALVIILIALPVLFAIVLVIIAHDRGGPVLFKQERIGRHGRPFLCLKFRTMCIDADRVLRDLLAHDPAAHAEWRAAHKLTADPRVSRIGQFLRSTSLDELPQLWNVLRGDMSLVGPRPVTQGEVEDEYTVFGGVQEYFSVRPGLTGLWQVSGRNEISYERRVALDKAYVRNLSIIGDAIILYRTIGAVLRRNGAR
jgi:lipopolysaccharide/colanic/teichoic acid biosynthesis glycosyltransferase